MQSLEEHRDELGEPFLASCFAYLQKASEDELDDIVLLIQRILQMYAARHWSQVDADGQADALLQDVLTSDPQNWENMIHDLATSGVTPHRCAASQVCVVCWLSNLFVTRWVWLQL